jgi:hypothetical protein
MNIAKVLLESKNEFNGHKQTTISHLPLADCLELCKALEIEAPNSSFVCELWTCGRVTIYQKDYWGWQGVPEHPRGHKDRMIVQVENTNES